MFQRIFAIVIALISFQIQAAPNQTELEVWANEAIITTYTYDYQNFLTRQKEIAKYFTAQGWIAYSKALQEAKLIESVQQNNYSVSAVATLPPKVSRIKDNHWQAQMPILVLYKGAKFQQTQTLDVTLNFTLAASGQGVRGFSITSLQAKTAAPPCRCMKEAPKATIV